MTELGKSVICFFCLLLFFFALTSGAFGQTLTRSHACYDLADSQTLATHLVEKGWVGYEALYLGLEAEGKCVGVSIPTPAPGPPMWTTESATFHVGLFPLISESGKLSYGLLLGRYARLSGA